jgi:hypothetical protein
MALATTTSTIQYNGSNTANQVCPVPFRFFANSDLVVQTLSSTGVLSTLTLGTNYSVTGADQVTGGSVTIFSATPATTKIQISRDVPETQLVSFTTGDRLPASSLERALDKLTMLVQELSRGLLRAIRVSDLVPNQPVLTPPSNTIFGTDATNTMTFFGSGAATGATPYFLAAPSAGATPAWIPLPEITNARLGTDSVSTIKLQDDAVTPPKIGGNPATGQWLLGSTNGEVVWQLPSSTSLEDGAVTTTKLADDAVTSAKLSASTTDDSVRAVTSDHIQNNAVGSAKLRSDATTDANRAVTTNHIRDNAITASKLSSSSTTDSLRAVTTNHIQNNAVTDDQLQSSINDNTQRAVGTNHIKDSAITTDKIDGGAVTHGKLSSGMVVGRGGQDSSNIFAFTQTGTRFSIGSAVPTTSQGTQVLAVSYTPKSVGNVLRIRFSSPIASSATATNVGVALFADTTFLGGTLFNLPASTYSFISCEAIFTAPATATTFSARVSTIGGTATTNVMWLNASTSGTANWTGNKCLLEVIEYKA